MICPQCQKQNQEGAKFCPYCGYAFQEVQVNVNSEQLQNNQQQNQTTFTQQMSGGTQQTQMHMPPNQAQAENFMNQFMDYFVNGLKNPSRYAKYQGGAKYVNGYIILGLCALFYGLAIAMIYRFVDRALSFIGISSYSFFSQFFTHLIIHAAVLAIAIGLIFVFVKNGMKLNVSFNHVVGRFGTLAIILLLCHAVSFLFAIPSLIWLQSFAEGLSNAVLFFIIIMTIQMYAQESNQRFEPIFGGIIIAAVISLLNSILTTSMFSGMFF